MASTKVTHHLVSPSLSTHLPHRAASLGVAVKDRLAVQCSAVQCSAVQCSAQNSVQQSLVLEVKVTQYIALMQLEVLTSVVGTSTQLVLTGL